MNLTLVKAEEIMHWPPEISKMLFFPLCLKQARMIRPFSSLFAFQWLIIGCRFNKYWSFTHITSGTPVSKTHLIGVIPNAGVFSSQKQTGLTEPRLWGADASHGSLWHQGVPDPSPISVPPLWMSRSGEPIWPKSHPLLIREEKQIFASVWHDLRWP